MHVSGYVYYCYSYSIMSTASYETHIKCLYSVHRYIINNYIAHFT